MSKIIEFDDIQTYPLEILEFADKNNFEDYDKDYFNIDIPQYLVDKLDEYKFTVYHCTRTVHIDNFKKYGILVPNDPRLRNILLNDTDGCDLNDYKNFSLGRGLDIQFVFSYHEICSDHQYVDFFENIGGEIIRGTKDYDENRLIQGNCYIIKFLINSSEMSYKVPLIRKMIKKIKYNWDVSEYGSITHNVDPNDIVDYIPADGIYKRLKEMY